MEEEEKGQYRTGQEKGHKKGLYFTYLGRSPHWSDLDQKLCSDVLDVITCTKFQNEIFRGYDFTGGRISHFPIDFWMGLTTVQSYCAAWDNSTQNRNMSSWLWTPLSQHVSRIYNRNIVDSLGVDPDIEPELANSTVETTGRRRATFHQTLSLAATLLPRE